jgi:hypothetical protein
MQSTYAGHEGTLAKATEAVARVRDEINQLWYDSMMKSDETAADRLVAASHLIRNAHYLLGGTRSIG